MPQKTETDVVELIEADAVGGEALGYLFITR